MTELQAPKGVSDEELRDTILKLAAEGALRVTSNSALFSNEAEIHHYVADKLRDNPDFRIKTEVCRSDYDKWAAKPEFPEAFSVDLIIWNRGAKVEDDQVRAIVEFKLTAADTSSIRTDIERMRKLMHGLDHHVLGLGVVCASYKNQRKIPIEISDAVRLADDLGCTVTPKLFEAPVDEHYGVVIGLTIQ